MKEIVIQAHYYDLLDQFKRDNPDKEELDFINNEIDFYKDFISDFENDPITEQCNEKFKEANLIEYKTYYNYFKDKLRTLQPKSKESIKDEIDLSDSKGTEKIIMLEELGVLDFLKKQEPFNLSTNALASAISGITGIKQTSVYPMINPIFNKGVNQKNNPLNTEKTVTKVNLKLSIIGFNPTK